jgi:hypothetical protein
MFGTLASKSEVLCLIGPWGLGSFVNFLRPVVLKMWRIHDPLVFILPNSSFIIILPIYSVNKAINIKTFLDTYTYKRKTAVVHNHSALKGYIGEVVVKIHVFYTTALDGGHLPHLMRLGGSLRSLNIVRKRILPIPEVVVKCVSSCYLWLFLLNVWLHIV